MNDPFSSYDTFSVGAEFDALKAQDAPSAPKSIPLLARLQRLSPPTTETIKRYDEAATSVTGNHSADAAEGYGADPMPSTASTPFAAPRRSPLGDPTATIRIDTVAPVAYDNAAASPVVQPAAKPASDPIIADDTGDDTLNDPWTSWLLNLESAVLPYSRVIVLAAVIAALGLTLVLLQGSAAKNDATEGPTQVQIESLEPILATNDQEAPPFQSWEPVAAQEISPNASNDLRPLDSPDYGPSTALASGPASADRRPGHATLLGEVQPVTPERVNVADAAGQSIYTRTK